MKARSSLYRRATLVGLVLMVTSQACTWSLFQTPAGPGTSTQTPVIAGPTSTPRPVAQTTFIVSLPEPLQPGETLALAILDEVTGLSLNATYYPMSARDALTYTAVLPLPQNSVIKYRYVRRGASQVNEDTTPGTPVRYRMVYAIGPGEVQDIIADWS